eukprot:CAMPEP_0203862804 /NCGR_PEP_ID=MMETSP0359-20131031/13797_1 /ASSEMBLY_ACC=CAM_ASM_000338 /TAXON_ID=268821 /ORGANISM="Scrippsiella Hangoei, Strain SHTV-5" /LENGTH=114 /DNA_ID=CAMNT_0050780251 /DNA_START=361 /DNA_END=703 /DNA_ORIENTATION=-
MSRRGGDGGAVNMMSVTDAVTTAISRGAPAYNMGDHKGCFDIYSRTAQSLMARQNLATSDRMVLQDGMRQAQMSSDPRNRPGRCVTLLIPWLVAAEAGGRSRWQRVEAEAGGSW